MSTRDEERMDAIGRSALSAARGDMPTAVKRAVRGRVMAAARSDAKRARWALVSRRAAVSFALVATLSGGVAYAASGSLPGDFLYPVKRASERVAVAVVPPGAFEDGLLARIAERRAVEALELARDGAAPGVFDHAIAELEAAVTTAFGAGSGLPAGDADRIRDRATGVPEPERTQIEDAIGSPANPGAGPTTQPGATPGATPGQEPNPDPGRPENPGGPGPSGPGTDTPGGSRGP